MNKEILDAVTKHLPSMQMEVLKQELYKAQKYEELTNEITTLNIENMNLLKKVKDLSDKISNEEMLNKRVQAVEKREMALDVELLKKEIECHKFTLQKVYDLSVMAFRNPTVYKNYNRGIAIPSGGYASTVCDSETTSQD